MPEADHGFKLIARTTGSALTRIAGLHCATLEPIESTLQTTTERLADRVFRTGRGANRYLVYMEFYTYWDRHAPWNLLAKTGLLAETERLPVATLVFILRRRGYRSQNGIFRLNAGGQITQQLRFHEVPMWRLTPEPWWDDVPGLMALYPLCNHGLQPKKAIQHAIHAIEAVEPTPLARADMLTHLSIFGKLAYPNLGVIQMIGREKMKESKFFAEVKEMGREEDRVATSRKNVLTVTSGRFGTTVAQRIAPTLNMIEEVDRLEEVLLLAATCSSATELC